MHFFVLARAENFSGACARLVSADWWTIAFQPIAQTQNSASAIGNILLEPIDG